MDLRTLALKIAYTLPNLNAYDTITLASELLKTYPDEDVKYTYSPKSLSVKALTLPLVIDAASRGLKINAIKELRQATQCGLKEAKEAIEHENFTRLFPAMVQRPWTGYDQ